MEISIFSLLLVTVLIIILSYYFGTIQSMEGVQGLPFEDEVQVNTVSDYEKKKRQVLSQSGEHSAEYSAEYFASGAAAADSMVSTDADIQGCGQDFANTGAPFTDWVKANAIDNTLIANHTQFVNDTGTRGTYTGRTYTADMHDSYDPIKWVGLMRPQNVPVGNPDQIPDLDRTLYSNEQTIKF